RRRHTRSKRDWSSDVCSSDLSTKPLDKDELPEFEEDQAAAVFTGYVQVTIDNIPPIVPSGGIKYRIDPGGKITINLKDNGVKPKIGRASCRERGKIGRG